MTGAGEGQRHRLVVPPAKAGERLDRFLAEAVPETSRKAVKRALDGGRVFVDERVERRAGRLLAAGEVLVATLPGPRAPEPLPEVPVLFRDDELLAVNKPPGLPSHPTVAGRANALAGVRSRLGPAAEPILLHRLDADTSGVLLFALTGAANRALAAAFAGRRVTKTYLALVAGEPPERFAVVNHLRPGVRGRTVAVPSGGQAAHTEFLTLGRGPGFALVEARPRSGRTHQIRVHLAGEGFPLLGDALYGGPSRLQLPDGTTLVAPRHLLHACRLAFSHPADDRPLQIEAPTPEDFMPFLENLAKVFENKESGYASDSSKMNL